MQDKIRHIIDILKQNPNEYISKEHTIRLIEVWATEDKKAPEQSIEKLKGMLPKQESRTAEPNFHMEYNELTEEFEVYEVKKRHENGNASVSDRIATCGEEGDAIQIINALNSRERVEALEKDLEKKKLALSQYFDVWEVNQEKIKSLESKLSAMEERTTTLQNVLKTKIEKIDGLCSQLDERENQINAAEIVMDLMKVPDTEDGLELFHEALEKYNALR